MGIFPKMIQNGLKIKILWNHLSHHLYDNPTRANERGMLIFETTTQRIIALNHPLPNISTPLRKKVVNILDFSTPKFPRLSPKDWEIRLGFKAPQGAANAHLALQSGTHQGLVST